MVTASTAGFAQRPTLAVQRDRKLVYRLEGYPYIVRDILYLQWYPHCGLVILIHGLGPPKEECNYQEQQKNQEIPSKQL